MTSSKLPELSDIGRARAGVQPHRSPTTLDRGVGTEETGGAGEHRGEWGVLASMAVLSSAWGQRPRG